MVVRKMCQLSHSFRIFGACLSAIENQFDPSRYVGIHWSCHREVAHARCHQDANLALIAGPVVLEYIDMRDESGRYFVEYTVRFVEATLLDVIPLLNKIDGRFASGTHLGLAELGFWVPVNKRSARSYFGF